MENTSKGCSRFLGNFGGEFRRKKVYDSELFQESIEIKLDTQLTLNSVNTMLEKFSLTTTASWDSHSPACPHCPHSSPWAPRSPGLSTWGWTPPPRPGPSSSGPWSDCCNMRTMLMTTSFYEFWNKGELAFLPFSRWVYKCLKCILRAVF